MASETQEVSERFSDTYAEVSLSGNGIHLYAKVEEDFVLDTSVYYLHAGSFEIYMEGATNRFSTLSANVLHVCEATEQTEVVQWLLQRFMRRPARQASTVAVEKHSGLSDDEVIQKANCIHKANGFAPCGRVVGRSCIRRSQKPTKHCAGRWRFSVAET